MTGKMTVDLKDLPLYKIPIFIKAAGVKLVGTFYGIKKTEFGNLDIFVVQTKDACYGRVGHLGEQVVVMPGWLVGFTLNDSSRGDFQEADVKEGDVVSLVIHDACSSRNGGSIWNETFTKVSDVLPSSAGVCGHRYFVDSGASGYDATCMLRPGHQPTSNCSGEVLKPGSSSRSWVDIVASAKYAYSATGGDLHGRMILLAGSIIDFEDDRGLVVLVEQARAAKKAYDDEYNEHGCWKIGDDGESNSSRWLRASQALAKAMIGEGGGVG